MKSRDYWIKRFEALENRSIKKGEELYALIRDEFDKASTTLQNKINMWYARFAENNSISITEAKTWLKADELKEFKWTVEEYIKYGKENALNQRWVRQLENASAKVHISRYEALQLELQQQLEILYGNQLDNFDLKMSDIYTDKYYHTAFELQKGFNVGWYLGALEDSQITKVLNKPWTLDKLTFSDKIWNNKASLLDTLQTDLTQAMLLGKNPYEVTKTIAQRFSVSKSQAGRLAMTESAYFASEAQKTCFNDLDVEKYEIVATLDSHTSALCQSLDGKIEEMKNYQVGVTAPPFHPWCRTTTCPYFDDDEDYVTRAARGADGKTYQVPADMKYSEWKEKYVNDATTDRDKAQFSRYKTLLGNKVPDGIDSFLKIKYNDDKSDWEKLKKLVDGNSRLQQQVQYSDGFIPKSTKFANVPKTIAGAGHDNPIREIDRLIKEHGGTKEDWTKKVVKINSNNKSFDIHYYEYDGLQYKLKVKKWKEVVK